MKPRAVNSGKDLLPLKKVRSCGYPLLALPRAIEAAKTLCDGFGEGPYSRENAARGLGYSSFSGAASSKIGALAHFGLLSRSGGMYLVAALAKAAFIYPEEGSGEAIMALAQNPALYRKLIARFLNKPLPEKLEAVLAADYGITGKAAPAAAQNFIETLEFAGLVRDGKLVLPESGNDGAVAVNENLTLGEKPRDAITETAIKIKLPSKIEISFPENLAYRLSLGEFAQQIKDLNDRAGAV